MNKHAQSTVEPVLVTTSTYFLSDHDFYIPVQ